MSSTDASSAAADARPLGQRLKEDNWDLHQLAERDALPQRMAAGTLPEPLYVEMLGQMYLANRALDEAIVRRRGGVPILAELVSDRQLQAPYLEADLRHFGVDPSALEALPGTAALIEAVGEIESSSPVGLFGLHYVREGANNGNRFIAMKLRQAYGAGREQAEGFRYLDPYGAEQRPLWESFKERLNAFELSEAEKGAIVSAARQMFELIMATHRDYGLEDGAVAAPAGAGS